MPAERLGSASNAGTPFAKALLDYNLTQYKLEHRYFVQYTQQGLNSAVRAIDLSAKPSNQLQRAGICTIATPRKHLARFVTSTEICATSVRYFLQPYKPDISANRERLKLKPTSRDSRRDDPGGTHDTSFTSSSCTPLVGVHQNHLGGCRPVFLIGEARALLLYF